MTVPKRPKPPLYIIRFTNLLTDGGDEYHLAPLRLPDTTTALCGQYAPVQGNLGIVNVLYAPVITNWLSQVGSWVCWPCQEVFIDLLDEEPLMHWQG